ncbi:hypothetical protein [Streptomyces chiangmaiensis]|uniref:Uncharacterized protein n=1 Tax=Streptomyces chiangmaiensis TaxID=766497 RepID=A0ABU7FV33_9ACTN|nr:hypothetical protein [Streptomyces chiangmaiensis]MED7827976.1 hypothetical protein [Streptomyces chiangmaiensis]
MMLQVQEQTDAVFIEARPRPHDGGRDGRFYLTSSQVIGGVEMGRQGRNLQLHLDRRYTGGETPLDHPTSGLKDIRSGSTKSCD